MTIFWESDRQAVDNVTAALGPDLHSVESGAVAVRSFLEDGSATLLVIGPGVALTAAFAVAEELRQSRPEVGVVLMRQRLDVSLLSQAARAGVREVVDASDLGGLVSACRRSRELSERLGAVSVTAADGRLLTVFSAKGGCGKTALSVNLAAQLALRGSRTLLIDLDLAFGDDAIALGLAPERSSLDLVAMVGTIDGAGLRSVVTVHDCGLEVLCAPPQPGDGDRVTPSLITEMLRVARREYDAVVIDTPPMFDERVIAALDASDLVFVLTTPDIPSLKNLRLALETLDLLGLPEDLRRVVLNRAGAKTGLTLRDVTNALHRDVDGQVPESVDVGQTINRGVPLVLHRPKHPVSAAVRRLLDAAVGAPVQEEKPEPDAAPVDSPVLDQGAARAIAEPKAREPRSRSGRRRHRRGTPLSAPAVATSSVVGAVRGQA